MSEGLPTPEKRSTSREHIELTASPEVMPPIVSLEENLGMPEAQQPVRLATAEAPSTPEKAKKKRVVLPFLFNNLYWILAAIPTAVVFATVGPAVGLMFTAAVITGGRYSAFWKILTLASLGGLVIGNAVPLAFHIFAMGLYALLKAVFPAKHQG